MGETGVWARLVRSREWPVCPMSDGRLQRPKGAWYVPRNVAARGGAGSAAK